jgi:hypothetical protein
VTNIDARHHGGAYAQRASAPSFTPPTLTEPAEPATVPGALRAAAIASLGAGAIHATAAGAHSEPRSAAVAFAVVAALQIAWGALALMRSGRVVGLLGVAVNGAALAGWVLAKTSGISFVDGLEDKEAPQFADSLAAGLAAVAVVGALLALASRVAWVSRPRPGLVALAGLATFGLVVPGMVSTGGHSHAGGAGHDDTDAGGAGHDDTAAGGHGHAGDEAEDGHAHAEATVPPEPYMATLPVNLGGVDGVSASQQTEAEALVTETLDVLPAEFSDWTTLEARGWYSIGDGFTGHEHFINWPLLEDGKMFDPAAPESLVFEVDGDQKTLVAAMFMASRSMTLDEVPDFGGNLVQWHIHDDLCYIGPEYQWRVAGLAPPPAECAPPTFKLAPHPPMIHVWVTPHECGPFASLEGNGGGSIPEGEERLCDHAHGAPGAGEHAAAASG